MKKSTYRARIEDVLISDQLQNTNGTKDEIVIKTQKQIYNSHQQMMKQGKITDKAY